MSSVPGIISCLFCLQEFMDYHSVSCRSSKEIKVGETSGSPDMRSDRDSSERKIELSSPSTTETSTSSTGICLNFLIEVL